MKRTIKSKKNFFKNVWKNEGLGIDKISQI